MKGEIISLDDLEEYIKNNAFQPRNNSQDVFIAGTKIGDGSKDDPLIIVFTSRACLKYLKDQAQTGVSQFGLDSTFKVNELRYPLTCWATQDIEHRTYPIAFAVSNSECETTYIFMLQTIKNAYQTLYNMNLSPKFIMSDAADYIFKATETVFGVGATTHLVCYFHLKQALKRNFTQHSVNKEDHVPILRHVDAMRKSVNQLQFNKYYDLFKAQYSHYNSFLEYFEKQWVSQSSKTNKWTFYQSDSNVLMTNNICESLNATIKRDFTNRERLSLH